MSVKFLLSLNTPHSIMIRSMKTHMLQSIPIKKNPTPISKLKSTEIKLIKNDNPKMHCKKAVKNFPT